MRSARRGFSLIEVLIASAVLATAMVPILFLFPTGARRTAFGEAQLRAHLRAEALLVQSIDMAIRTGFKNLPEGAPVPAAGGRSQFEAVRFDPIRGYAGLWSVTAEVEWEAPAEMGGGKRTYTVERLVHRSEQGLVGDWPLGGGAHP